MMDWAFLIWIGGAIIVASVSLIMMDTDAADASFDAALWPISVGAIVIMTIWLAPQWLYRKIKRAH